jgi:hypothetical protein
MAATSYIQNHASFCLRPKHLAAIHTPILSVVLFENNSSRAPVCDSHDCLFRINVIFLAQEKTVNGATRLIETERNTC